MAAFALAAEEKAEPLVLTPENTAILDASTYSGQALQYYLIKCVAKAADAETYRPFVKQQADRSASAAFPLFRDAKKLPPRENLIAVGPTSYLTDADRQRLKENRGSMLLRRQRVPGAGDGRVVVIAADERNPWGSPFTAVAAFLDRCAGVRLYAPGDLWLSMPKSREIAIGELDLFQKPFFAKADFSYSGASAERNAEWQRLNEPLSESAPLRANHALASYFNPDKYYATHPEVYEMKDGQRPKPQGGAWNPCLSAAALPEIAMAEVRERVAKGKPSYLSFGVMDCAFDCQCPACQASVKAHSGSYSTLYYAFLNQVARQCQKEFPGLYLTAYIYSNVRTPPEGMRIEPNIVVDSVIKSYHFVDPAAMEREKARIRAFSALGARWLTHDWCFSGVSPRSYLRQYASFLQWAAQNGMAGIYVEWSPGESWYLDGAKYWILRRLMTNPYQDVEALWRQYCDDMYGAGGEAVFRLFRHFADKFVYSDRYIVRADIPRQEFCLYTADDLDCQRALIRKAMDATKDDPLIEKRFEVFNRYWRAHELFAEACGEIARIDYRHAVLEKRTDLNTEALAWYLTETGSRISEAIAYYLHQRTVPPDSNALETALGGLPSYVNNYSRAMGRILLAIRRQAMARVDLARMDKAKVQAVVAACKKILRDNAPAKALPENLAKFDRMLGKVLWVPTAEAMPKLDGDLSDPAWAQAADLKDWTIRDTFQVSKHETSGKILRVGGRLVVGLVCRQAGPIWAATTPDIHTGTRIWRESGVEFFLGPAAREGETAEFAQYIVNALGAFRGFGQAADNREGVEAAVRLDRDAGAYTIEAAFPLKAKGYDYTREKVLSFNLMRDVFTSDSFQAEEIIGWHPIFYTAQNAESRGLIFLQ